jgi:uncharacterized membrane protein
LARISIERHERHEFSMRSSPLPEPSELAAYNQIIPNDADRILKMAEAQSAHRIAMEAKVISSQQTQGFCGQLFGLIIGLFAIGCATYASISGQPWFGSIIGGATLVSLVSTFLYGRNSQKRELSKKNSKRFPNCERLGITKIKWSTTIIPFHRLDSWFLLPSPGRWEKCADGKVRVRKRAA